MISAGSSSVIDLKMKFTGGKDHVFSGLLLECLHAWIGLTE